MHRKHNSRPLCGLFLGLIAVFAMSSAAFAADGYLGVQTQKLNKALMAALDLEADSGGVLVNDVVGESPAEVAGLQRGDLITAIDGKTLETPAQLRRRIRSFEAGDTITVDVVRKGKSMSLDIELGELDHDLAMGNRMRWESDGDSHFPRVMELDDLPGDGNVFFLNREARPRIGVSLHELDDQLGDYFDTKQGMLVLSVEDDSPAAEAGIASGDVIVEAAGEAVTELEDLHDVLDEHEAGDSIQLSVLRKGKKQSIEVELGEAEHMARVLDEFGSLHERMPRAPRNFEFRRPHSQHRHRAPQMERFRLRADNDELEELREELQQLRKELEELKDK